MTSLMPARVSPSQLKTFAQCNRKWWIEKIAKVPTPSTQATERGHAIHTFVEHYLLHGVMPDEPAIAAVVGPALLNLPTPPVSPKFVEAEVSFDLPDPPVALPPIFGRLDLIEPFDEANPPEQIHIIDHKTTSDWRYTKSPDDLRHDPQAIVYGAWVLRRYPLASSVKFTHNYILTKKGARPDTRQSFVVLERDEIERALLTIRDTVTKMVIAAGSMETEVPYNLDACDMYGGCPFKSRCSSTGLPTLGFMSTVVGQVPSVNKVKDMALPPPPPPRPGAVPNRPAPPPPPRPMSAAEQWKAKQQGGVISVPAPVEDMGDGINPPDEIAAPAPTPVARTAPPPPPPAPEKRGPGRPPGAKNKPKDPPAPAPAPTPTSADGEVLVSDDGLRATIAELMAEKNKLRADLDRQQEIVDAAQGEVADLRESVQALQATNNDLIAKNASLNEAIEELEVNINGWTKAYDELKDSISNDEPRTAAEPATKATIFVGCHVPDAFDLALFLEACKRKVEASNPKGALPEGGWNMLDYGQGSARVHAQFVNDFKALERKPAEIVARDRYDKVTSEAISWILSNHGYRLITAG